jgi:hypothetical protein
MKEQHKHSPFKKGGGRGDIEIIVESKYGEIGCQMTLTSPDFFRLAPKFISPFKGGR